MIASVTALSIWYLVQPQPLLVLGEVDATRFDIAARVDGRVAVPVVRGHHRGRHSAGAHRKNEQAVAAKVVADAQLANINVGTRVETIAARKAALERAKAGVVLVQKTYDCLSQLAEQSARELRWLLHDRAARLLILGVPTTMWLERH